MHRLKIYLISAAPNSNSLTTQLNTYKTISGLEKQLIILQILLSQLSKSISFNTKTTDTALFVYFNNIFLQPLLPDTLSAHLLKNLYLLRLLLSKTYNCRRFAKKRPIHGQSR